MDADDYTRYGDYKYDLVLDTKTAVAVAATVAVDNVVDCLPVAMCDYLHVKSAIDSVDK